MRRTGDKTDLCNLAGMLDNVPEPVVTDEDRQAARLTICDYAEDATVARDLMDALGLLA